jgi:methylsterol monooxygenase
VEGSMATVYEQLYTNATVLVTDFIKSTQQNDVANLYAGVDPTRLNWLEQAWMQWYQYIGNTTVATGIMSFVLHEVSPPVAHPIEPLFLSSSVCAC